jgi:phosphate:Na+ symporter
MTGLGMIFVGLKLMSSACNDDSIKGFMADVLQKISFPLILEFFGILFTAIIQSSSAMTGIIIVMVGNGAMGLDSGLFITLGANVGTCVTALIGIIGANDNSKRTAVIHLVFNICGVLIFTPILWIFKSQIIGLLGSLVSKEAMQIAYFHLCFNITTALITTPLIDYLEKIAYMVIREPKEDVIESFIKEKENFDIGHRDTTTDMEADVNKEKDEDNIIIKEKDEKYEPPKIEEKEGKKDGEEKDKEDKEEKIEVKDEVKKEEKKESDNVEEKHENKDEDKIDVRDIKEEEKKDGDNAEEKQEKKDEEIEVNNKEEEKKEEGEKKEE